MRAILVLALCFHAAVSDSSSWMRNAAGEWQSDLIFTPYQERMLLNSSNERNAIRNLNQRWPGGVVYYQFSDQFNDQAEKNRIVAAFSELTSKTCITIVERENNERDYVEIIKDGGCYSYWGRTGGRQPISLPNGCQSVATVVHEFMHALGFLHEQSRYDRDNYVTIITQNIWSGLESQFDKASARDIDLLGLDYDLNSVMHYSEWAFSRNGEKTIVAKDGTSPLGNEEGLTLLDAAKINKLYECSTTEPTTSEPATTDPTTSDPETDDPTTSDPETDDPTTDDPTTEDPASCEDTFGRMCARWESRGFCERRGTMKFMQENCQKSCETCQQGTCADDYNQCRGFARRNWCSRENFIGDWMEVHCPYSCGYCS